MSEAIIVAIITGGFSLIGVLIANRKSAQAIDQKLEIHQAVTDTKLEELTREVRKHNNFAEKLPRIETQLETMEKTVSKLQQYHME